MPQIIFLAPDGTRTVADGDIGQSVMEVGKRYGIEGIVAECGGCSACATCQVYVDADWQAVVGAPSSDETDMLDFAFEPRPESRLSCQIRLRPDMQGLVVRLPTRQR